MQAFRRQQYTTRLTLRVSARLAGRLSTAAREDDRTASEFVRELLRRELLAGRRGCGEVVDGCRGKGDKRGTR
jgi:hypothetical protein